MLSVCCPGLFFRVMLEHCCASLRQSHASRQVPSLGLRKTQSTPASLERPQRTFGTSLRPQDEPKRGSYCHISFAGAGNGGGEKQIIPLDIAEADLPDYWRSAAGGEHNPQE